MEPKEPERTPPSLLQPTLRDYIKQPDSSSEGGEPSSEESEENQTGPRRKPTTRRKWKGNRPVTGPDGKARPTDQAESPEDAGARLPRALMWKLTKQQRRAVRKRQGRLKGDPTSPGLRRDYTTPAWQADGKQTGRYNRGGQAQEGKVDLSMISL